MQNRLKSMHIAVVIVVAAWSLAPRVVLAGGYEYPIETGTRGVGRGGAMFAKADDPMALFYNPAALASIPGTQAMVGGNLLNEKLCFDRTGSYSTSWGTVGGNPIPFPKVCNDKNWTVAPNLAASFRVSSQIGMAIGLAPPSAVRSQRFGGRRAVDPAFPTDASATSGGYIGAPANLDPGTEGAVDINGNPLLPNPGRWMLNSRDLLVVFPTIGLGVRPFDWMQFGLSISAGIADLHFTNHVMVLGEDSEEGAANQFESDVQLAGRDYFIPRFTASMHFIPLDGLDIAFGLRWTDTIQAKGSVNGYSDAVRYSKPGDPRDGRRAPVTGGVLVSAPQPLWLSYGVRYAQRRVPRAYRAMTSTDEHGKVRDSLSEEVWDVELNVIYERNSQVDAFTVKQGEASPVQPGTNESDYTLAVRLPAATIRLPHLWQDQLSIRVGGDWNVVPNKLALRVGGSFETNGYKKQVGLGDQVSGAGLTDFGPLRRQGIHAGLTARFNRLELTGGLAMFFMQDLTVTNGAVTQIVIPASSGQPTTSSVVVNNGAMSNSAMAGSVALRYFIR